MEDSLDSDFEEPIPFTFPQVRPLYAKLLNEANRSTKKPLKPFRAIQEPVHDVPANIEYGEKIQEGNYEDDDDTPSVNSLSGDLKPNYNKSHSRSGELIQKVNESHDLDKFITPLPMKLRPAATGKRTTLVKRVPKLFSTPCFKIHEENFNAKVFKLSQPPDFEIFSKTTGKHDKLFGESRNNKDGKVLKDILNNLNDLSVEKSVDVRATQDSTYMNTDNKGGFIMPSIITYRKGTDVSDVTRKSPRATNKTPAIEMNKNSRSCATKLQQRNENRDFLEKYKREALFKEPEEEKLEIRNFNPSTYRRAEPSVLFVNNVQYSVLSKLGQGGSSQVYQVLDNKTSTLVAVKCVNLVGADEVTAEGYLKEIEMLSKLQSSNRVIKLLDHEYSKKEQVLYVVMEKGDTDLSTLLRQMTKSGDVSLPMIIYYWTEMLHAVKDIHNHGIVHADLKPANFLLVCGRLKLIDFGIASAIQTDATSVFKSSMHGTCNYMSPEAIQDPGDSSRTKVGYKSDVWSLGCILYNLLYQKTPFQHITNNMKKLQLIVNPNHRIEFPPVEKCPPPLMDALKCCLRYDARKRPTIAQLVATDYIWPTGK